MGDPLEPNYSRLCAEIREAAEKTGRNPDTVRLLAVSKKVSAERLRILWGLGHRLFGENRVQEARAKIPDLPTGGEWHFIGGLQTNKARDAVEWFDVVESVDRVELAAELHKRAEAAGKTLAVLLEINVGGEAAKSGAKPEEAQQLFQAVNAMSRLEVRGLMAIPPFREEPEEARPFFRRLREIRNQLEQASGAGLPELSMGMSHDFKVAIAEGATLVRIGTALFGPRAG
ncbi:MAG: YggS family pyridoxal phosphate-dependent enzyme [Verrucomicrobia bacterium]|nr:YggS family pyridoxal phosphate-dependent enzyme [Verrucomicrobiota bacterium]